MFMRSDVYTFKTHMNAQHSRVLCEFKDFSLCWYGKVSKRSAIIVAKYEINGENYLNFDIEIC